MNYRALTIVFGTLIVSCVYIPTQQSPFSDASAQFVESETTGAEVFSVLGKNIDVYYSTFNNHRYVVYESAGKGIYASPVAVLACGSPIGTTRSPVKQIMLFEFDHNDRLVRFDHVRDFPILSAWGTVEYRSHVLSETWSIPLEDIKADISPYKRYWADMNHPDAKKWLCQAADENNPEALHRLGVLFENGSWGISKNIEMAYFWYSLGAAAEPPWWGDATNRLGNGWSAEAAKRIEKELTPEQRINVQNMIKAWRPGQCSQLLVPDNSPH